MRPQKALAQHWSNLSVQTSRYHLVLLALIQKRRIGVEICISNDKAFGKAVFSHLAELERLLGVKGEPYDAEKSCGIRFYREGCDIKGKPEMWSDFINWQLRTAVQLRQAMLNIDKENPAETFD